MQSGCALVSLLNLINLINDVEAQDRVMNFVRKTPAAEAQDQEAITEQDKILMHEETFLENLYLKINPKKLVEASMQNDVLDELKAFLRTFSETPTMHKRGKKAGFLLTDSNLTQ